jgi:hypothetical protein
MRLCEQEDTPPPVRLRGVRLFGRLCARLDFREHASRIALGMTRILSTASVYEYEPLMDTLCALVRGLGSDFAVFVPTVAADIERLDISHPAFEALIAPYRKGGAAAAPTGAAVAPPSREAALLMLENRDPLGAPPSPGLMPSPSLALAAANAYDGTSESPLNQKRLQSAWTTTERSTRADWHAWMRRLSVEMLRESPSPALRACTPLAQVCPLIIIKSSVIIIKEGAPRSRRSARLIILKSSVIIIKVMHPARAGLPAAGARALQRRLPLVLVRAHDRGVPRVLRRLARDRARRGEYEPRGAAAAAQPCRVHGARRPTAAHRHPQAGRAR